MSSDWDEWIGRQRHSETVLSRWPVSALAAVLDLDVGATGGVLPALWHWLYFLETASQSRIGADGHPQKGDFLPPVPNPRRMFAGARTRYLRPLKLEQTAALTETVQSVIEKDGGQGRMFLVTVTFDYHQQGQLCISEERDFMYLSAVEPAGDPGQLELSLTEIEGAPWSLDVDTDATRLMRFSALTFNSHRIHYDRDYAREQEGYPDLVVHGPLTAILLSELCRMNSDQPLTSFSFRARAPLFCGQQIRLRGEPGTDGARLQALRPDGKIAVTAEATFGRWHVGAHG